MRNAARRPDPYATLHEVATVVAVEEARVVLLGRFGEETAERAASCLVAPAPDDEVAVLRTADGRTFVVAILVRPERQPVEIAVDGDLRISARGSCNITADEVEVRSEGTASFVSQVFDVRAGEGKMVLGKLSVLASSLLARTEVVRVAGQTLDALWDRATSTAKRCYRKVEELDVLRAARLDHRAEKEMCLRSENFLVGARKLAKLDAEQIHIG
jgi:hypothetical protein